jgi:hypothetical protein
MATEAFCRSSGLDQWQHRRQKIQHDANLTVSISHTQRNAAKNHLNVRNIRRSPALTAHEDKSS